MVAVDTNVLVRWIVGDHPRLSPKARQIITQAKPGTILLDRLVIEEAGYVLKSNYGFTKPQINAVYKALFAEKSFFIPDREIVEVAVGLFEIEKPLSFEDCWLLALLSRHRVSGVATFDADLSKRLARA